MYFSFGYPPNHEEVDNVNTRTQLSSHHFLIQSSAHPDDLTKRWMQLKKFLLNTPDELTILKCPLGRKKMNKLHSKIIFHLPALFKSERESKIRVLKSSNPRKS